MRKTWEVNMTLYIVNQVLSAVVKEGVNYLLGVENQEEVNPSDRRAKSGVSWYLGYQ